MSAGMNKLIKEARTNRLFLSELLTDPVSAAASFDLDDSELEALSGNTASRLVTLVDRKVLAAGCGSSDTCTSTCTATCTVTFTSIVDRGAIVEARA